MHVISEEDPVDNWVKWKCNINCVIRKLYKWCMESKEEPWCFAQSLLGNFLVNRSLITQETAQGNKESWGEEIG